MCTFGLSDCCVKPRRLSIFFFLKISLFFVLVVFFLDFSGFSIFSGEEGREGGKPKPQTSFQFGEGYHPSKPKLPLETGVDGSMHGHWRLSGLCCVCITLKSDKNHTKNESERSLRES